MKDTISIADVRPDLAKQWNYEANGAMTQENTSAMSKQKVGWICDQGHKWTNDPQHRMRSKTAECPYCTGKKILRGENDLASMFPRLELEWNYDKNIGLDPYSLHCASNKRVWWICKKGHQWNTAINHRTHTEKPTNCPFCEGRKVAVGENDLASQRPDIAADWAEANAPLLPTQVTVGSGKRVWWTCKNGHSWKTSVAHRTESFKPTNCPYCEGRGAIPGETDLATLYPKLMEEWNYALNQDLDPTLLRPHSNKRAHWRCVRGHCWTAIIKSRTRVNGTNCPYCSRRRAIPGETDLQTRYPEIAKSWNWEKNGDMSPETISYASNKKVAWICDKGHHWEATVASRTCGKNGCPVCSGRKPEVGRNDLLTLRPDIALDWDDAGNGKRKPQEFTCFSGYIAAWRCHVCGTQWKKSIRARSRGNKCPSCNRERGERIIK